jgi:hypothetical protein
MSQTLLPRGSKSVTRYFQGMEVMAVISSPLAKIRAFFAVLLAAAFLAGGCEQPGGVSLEQDAALKSLSLSAGNLTPAFNAGTTAYKATVNSRIDTITITAVPNSERASVNSGGQISRSLSNGENRIDIVVTAEDGKTRKTYTVTVRKLDASTVMIESAADLKKIGVDDAYPLAKNYVLAADLELENWMPIGGGNDSNPEPFTGSFDGANHTITIKNFDDAVFTDGPVYLGIFGRTKGSAGEKAVIKNLNVSAELDHSVTKTGACYVGAVAGYADEFTELAGINVEGSLSFSNDNTAAPKLPVYVGGITGVLVASELKDSRVSANITGHGRASNGAYNYVGGLAGMFDRNAVTRGMNPKPNAGEAFTGASITNCRATGNVTGTTEGDRTNVFVGGIAGGACYGMKTYYSGKIEDCVSTGTISALGGGYWSMAGGIAGTISGDGFDDPVTEAAEASVTGPTRIVRCYATGTVTVTGAPKSWPYAGGIVAYNYYGGLVSLCWFSGEVKNGEGFDYTGGIAGYNSQYAGHNSRIEDCWSSGTVRGFVNAGGIVGQNQANAITSRCYSTAEVYVTAAQGGSGSASQQGAGGIAGYSTGPGRVENCVALNPSITSAGFERVYRVIGDSGTTLVAGGNLARSDMSISIGGIPSTNSDPGADAKDGEDCGAKPAQSAYESIGWDFTGVWKMGDEGYPLLRWEE